MNYLLALVWHDSSLGSVERAAVVPGMSEKRFQHKQGIAYIGTDSAKSWQTTLDLTGCDHPGKYAAITCLFQLPRAGGVMSW